VNDVLSTMYSLHFTIHYAVAVDKFRKVKVFDDICNYSWYFSVWTPLHCFDTGWLGAVVRINLSIFSSLELKLYMTTKFRFKSMLRLTCEIVQLNKRENRSYWACGESDAHLMRSADWQRNTNTNITVYERCVRYVRYCILLISAFLSVFC